MTRGYLEEIEAQLAERTARVHAPEPPPMALGRPPRRRREWLAIIPALAATAAIVVVVIAAASGGGSPARATHRAAGRPHARAALPAHPRRGTGPARGTATTRVNPTAPLAASIPTSPVPAGFGPVSFTAISEFRWWLLGTSPCTARACAAEIVRTEDGGRSFVSIPGPPTTQVSGLRFADASDGFAFGPQLWVTHDGGASWHRVDLQGQVTSLEAANGYVFAIVRGASDQGRLMRSPVDHDAWSALPEAGAAFTGLWVYGADVLLETSAPNRQLLAISTDSGAHFATHPAPPSVACQFEAMPPVVWAACATGTEMGIWRSTDGGSHWTGAGGDASRSGQMLPNSAAFGAAGPAVAVVGYTGLQRTADAGAHYAPTGPGAPGGIRWTYLGFTDATHGVALGTSGSEGPNGGKRWLYYTVDAGQSYHRVPIGSG